MEESTYDCLLNKPNESMCSLMNLLVVKKTKTKLNAWKITMMTTLCATKIVFYQNKSQQDIKSEMISGGNLQPVKDQ